MSGDFILGLVAGFLIAGVLGFVFAQIGKARKRIATYNSPQQVKMMTQASPWQVLSTAISGLFAILGWSVALIVLLGLVVLLVTSAG